jgi:hypothetical protein
MVPPKECGVLRHFTTFISMQQHPLASARRLKDRSCVYGSHCVENHVCILRKELMDD